MSEDCIFAKIYTEWMIPDQTLSLRVPLAYVQTTTYAFFPDETHNAIRRVFTPPSQPYTKRHFCGFCGTHLTHWSEEPPEEAEWVCINLSSLKSESMDKLEDWGILAGPDGESEDQTSAPAPTAESLHTEPEGREVKGNPWFEGIIEGSELGRIKRRRGGEKSADGRTRVEWEVVEFESGDADGSVALPGTGKRKIGSLGEEDAEMRGS